MYFIDFESISIFTDRKNKMFLQFLFLFLILVVP